MPPLMTYIARVSDGLPFVASFSTGPQDNIEEQKKQAKEILRNLNSNGRPVAKMSIETTNSKIFHYLIQENTVYLTCTEISYPKRLAFLYLEEIADTFLEYLTNQHYQQQSLQSQQFHHHQQYNNNNNSNNNILETTARPYAFIQADIYIQRKQRQFIDPKSTLNTNKINQDLSDIHSIMRQNITQVLDRGEKLENVGAISSNLMSESKKFKWGAKKLNWWARVYRYYPGVILGVLVLVLVYFKFFA